MSLNRELLNFLAAYSAISGANANNARTNFYESGGRRGQVNSPYDPTSPAGKAVAKMAGPADRKSVV